MSEETFTITGQQLRELFSNLVGISPSGEMVQIPPIFPELSSHRYSVKTAIKFKRLSTVLTTEFTLMESQRMELCELHGKKNEETGIYDIDPKQQETFDNETKELFSLPINIPINLKIQAEELRTPLTLKEAISLGQPYLDIPIDKIELQKLECIMETE